MPSSGDTVNARSTTPARSLPHVVHRFVETEASSGVVLLVVTLVALVWANSPWRHGYDSLWSNDVVVQVGGLHVAEDLRHFVNDGLMTLFFFVVGLEIKRERVRGELADLRVAALPVVAAIGGMVVPGALYLMITAASGTGHGWGIPIATDIAFSLGVLALFHRRLPPSLKLLLLTLAIVDDVGAIIVIAVFYGGSIDAGALAAAVVCVVLAALFHRVRVDWPPLYVALGVATWYATYRSGVHATIAGVAFALITPARALAPADTVRRWAAHLADNPGATQLRQMMVIARESVSPAEHIEDRLHPFTSFVILPCFALANAGIELRHGMFHEGHAATVAIAVAIGLVLGKFLGILGASWLAVRARIATLPGDVGWSHIAGIAALGGIGFTVSLFITGLAFGETPVADAAKLAILAASMVSAAFGAVLLRRAADRQRLSERSDEGPRAPATPRRSGRPARAE